jgi:hypothetical protein
MAQMSLQIGQGAEDHAKHLDRSLLLEDPLADPEELFRFIIAFQFLSHSPRIDQLYISSCLLYY